MPLARCCCCCAAWLSERNGRCLYWRSFSKRSRALFLVFISLLFMRGRAWRACNCYCCVDVACGACALLNIFTWQCYALSLLLPLPLPLSLLLPLPLPLLKLRSTFARRATRKPTTTYVRAVAKVAAVVCYRYELWCE